MRIKTAAFVSIFGLLAGCADPGAAIDRNKETLTPSKVKFSQYRRVLIKPLTAQAEVDAKSTNHIQEDLSLCMNTVFRNLKPFDAREATAGKDAVLVIEPSIVELRKVSTAQRMILGGGAGTSAALLKVTYTDYRRKNVVAEPTFYSRSAATAGAYTYGASDNLMLTRLANEACEYATQNF